MPLLIRIILQRLLVFVFSILAFFGVNPQLDILTDEEVYEIEEQIKIKEDEVSQIVKEVFNNQNKTQEVLENVINVPKIENSGSGLSFSEDIIEDVVVNIVCINKTPGSIKMSTGSGVIVSSSGLVLTNSHVANAFLFNDQSRDSHKECTIRRENIPTYGFKAEPVYISEQWLKNNESFFLESNPRGSGENDYAFLAITENTNPVLDLPASFKHVDLIYSEDPIDEYLEITVAAYPGTDSGIFEVDSNARLKKAITYIYELITFRTNTIDLVSTGPNDVAKRGSSGGGVFLDNNLLGIVVTTDEGESGSYINAITLPYIIRDFKEDTGTSLESFISEEKEKLILEFKKEENNLKRIIADFL